jgi:transposase
VWCWENLNVHLDRRLLAFAAEHSTWLTLVQMPAYAPDLNPAEGVWSLMKRAIANFVAAGLRGLVRIVKRKLKKIQFRPDLLDGCLAETGLAIEDLVPTSST